ncbi:hypothetical protein HNQ50_003204 [Silvimonas terrae]|uniref:Glycosyltransferase RgtA/B/C/D-like domain-containing protein n=1 Tax=Silvimonas terrae TaxID=300266 RepID=A0A840RJR6_9NEIS|nr:hypothetical protein [Silvimonas terrae]MBB5192463.1 hypothetical protein [Silvimonas terrae]
MAVTMTHPRGMIPLWAYPDNLLSKGYRFPLLTSLYGGNPSAYAGALFWGVFGYSAAKVFLLHQLYGAVVIILMFFFMKNMTGNLLFAFLTSVALAVEPSFLFAWRTQYYLQLFPLLGFIAGLGLLARNLTTQNYQEQAWRRSLFLAAVLLGLSAWGYFIYAIYGFAIFLVSVVLQSREPERRQQFIPLFAKGFVIGWGPYLYAHFSMLLRLRLSGYIDNLHSLQSTYGVMNGQSTAMKEKFLYALRQILGVTGGANVETLFYGRGLSAPVALYGTAIVIAGVAGLVLSCVLAGRQGQDKLPLRSDVARTAGLLLLGVLVMHLLFGTYVGMPLNNQHYVMLLFVTYAGLGLGAAAVGRLILRNGWRKAWAALVSVCFIGLIAVHGFRDTGIFRLLETTGGQGYYSDAINKLAYDAAAVPPDTMYLFPQWGYWMGFATSNGGKHAIQQAPDIEGLIGKINSYAAHNDDPLPVNFMLLLTGANTQAVATDFATRTGMQLKGLVQYNERNGAPAFTMYKLTRIVPAAALQQPAGQVAGSK